MGVWTFEQVGGDRTKLELADHAAPHGRPRQEPVVSDGIEIRENEVYYGDDGPPTRHIWGNRFDPWDLKGRFSDWYGGRGFARAKTDEVKAFVDAKQQCVITWDDEVSTLGFIKSFKPGRESSGEITWEMRVLIDSDNNLGQVPQFPTPPNPQGLANRILEAFAKTSKLPKVPDMMTGSVFDSLNNLTASLNNSMKSLNRAVTELNRAANAPFAVLRRFRTALSQMRSTLLQLRDTFDRFDPKFSVDSENSADFQLFQKSQADFSAQIAAALSDMAKADRAAVQQQRGTIKSTVTAQSGDTWERISQRVYGTADRASDIRDANSVQPGQPPVAGNAYLIPR